MTPDYVTVMQDWNIQRAPETAWSDYEWTFLKVLKRTPRIVMSAALALKPQAEFHNPRIG
jgi:hypothetical protein